VRRRRLAVEEVRGGQDDGEEGVVVEDALLRGVGERERVGTLWVSGEGTVERGVRTKVVRTADEASTILSSFNDS
jgi:hypothetical protein